MGNIPTSCTDHFTVNSEGATEEEARDNTHARARRVCTVTFPKKCSGAKEVGKGTWRTQPDGTYVYYGTYHCREEL